MRRFLAAAGVVVLLVWAACSDAPSGPATVDLNGIWRMSYTASESAFTCTFHDILLVFDSTASNPRYMSGGTGLCVGRGRYDTLFQNTSAVDSLQVGGGRIRFRVFGGWLFDGRIRSLDSLDGTTTQDGNYVGIGPIHLVGPWGAHRRPPLP
jgi:hypothetical protein